MPRRVSKEYNLKLFLPNFKLKWDYNKNTIDPEKIVPTSKKKAWFICKNNHSFYGSIYERHKGKDCGYCTNKIIDHTNNLEIKFPDLMKEWDYKKNIKKPSEYFSGSSYKVWWVCEKNKNHKWKTSIVNRTGKAKTGCPYCAGQKVNFTNNLKFHNPELVNEWNYEKNKNLLPENILVTSAKKVWWKCKKNPKEHQWQQTVYHRNNGIGCPYCSGHLASPENNLTISNPELMNEWDYEKNLNIDPKKFLKGNPKSVWWKCKYGHSWKTKILNRTHIRKTGCPLCNKATTSSFEIRIYTEFSKIFKNVLWQQKILKKEIDIYLEDYRLGIEYDGGYYHSLKGSDKRDLKKNDFFSKNNIQIIRIRDSALKKIGPNDLIINELESDILKMMKIIEHLINVFKFTTGHQTILNKYLKDKVLINSKEHRKILAYLPGPTPENSLEFNFPEIKDEWDYEKNYPLKPSMFGPSSQKSVWWNCKKGPDHKWFQKINLRTLKNKLSSCPFCYNYKLSVTNSISAKAPYLKYEWDYKKNFPNKPEDIIAGSSQIFWWICKINPNHTWQASAIGRSGLKKRGCPKCPRNTGSYQKTLEFNYPELSKKWHKSKNDFLLPSQVTPKSGRLVTWICENNHEFKQRIINFVKAKGKCPICTNNKNFQQKQ